jgi:SsrA-binding protein
MSHAENRKAKFDYEIMEEFEAGLELFGFEAKAIKAGKANLAGAFVIVRGGEAYTVGLQIDPYQVKNTPLDYDPLRTRRVLLKKSEIQLIEGETSQKGLTAIILSLYSKGPRVKARVAVVRGKKAFDKRESIKKRDLDRAEKRSFDN